MWSPLRGEAGRGYSRRSRASVWESWGRKATPKSFVLEALRPPPRVRRWRCLQPDAHIGVQRLKIVIPKLEASCGGARPCLGPS